MLEDFPTLLSESVFLKLMRDINADPIFSFSNGKKVMLLKGVCHHSRSGHHSVIFDYADSGRVTCMSACGDTVQWWNYIGRVLKLANSFEAKEWILNWLQKKQISNSDIINIETDDYDVLEKPFNPHPLPHLEGIDESIIRNLYRNFTNDEETLSRTLWYKEDKIEPKIMKLYDVAVYRRHGTIILPHHNIDGKIVGLYERNFNILRQEASRLYPDMPKELLKEFPRAKYIPLLKEAPYKNLDTTKPSWSFPVSRNLYGLHLAKESIRQEKKAIIFEGAKSVMLARQYGYPYGVASHTFGVNENQIALLIDQGVKDIFLAFDKQYQEIGSNEWNLYERKTKGVAERIKSYVNVYRICDDENLLSYKDSPIDNGKIVFEELFSKVQPLALNGSLIK